MHIHRHCWSKKTSYAKLNSLVPWNSAATWWNKCTHGEKGTHAWFMKPFEDDQELTCKRASSDATLKAEKDLQNPKFPQPTPASRVHWPWKSCILLCMFLLGAWGGVRYITDFNQQNSWLHLKESPLLPTPLFQHHLLHITEPLFKELRY